MLILFLDTALYRRCCTWQKFLLQNSDSGPASSHDLVHPHLRHPTHLSNPHLVPAPFRGAYHLQSNLYQGLY